MQFCDTLILDAPKRTKEGFMAVRARAARAGVYEYLGREVDPSGARFKADQLVNVYRPEDQVFDKASIASFIAKPVTNDHPAEAVTADNWKRHSRGAVMGALRDREYLAFDLTIMDGAAIADIEAGKRQLSNGYSCDLSFEDGVAPDGTAYQAVQRNIRGNHVALVDRGRAGFECRIADRSPDWASCDANPAILCGNSNQETGGGAMPHTLTIDGLHVPNVSDEAKACIEKLQGQIKDAEAKVATVATEAAAKDAKIATLEKAVADAKVSPAQLREAAKAFAAVCDKAKALGVKFDDAADADEIMKAAVSAKMGDAAKDWTVEQIQASFAVLAADAKAADPMREVIADGVASVIVDTAAIRDAARASRYN